MATLAVGFGLPVRVQVPTYLWSGGHTLILPINGIRGDELRAVKTSQAEFAIVEQSTIGVLLFRFGEALPWSDGAFNILEGGRVRLETIASIQSTTLQGDQRSILTTVLVEARSNVVQAIRVVSLSPAMSHEFLALLRRQITIGPITDAEMHACVAALYRRYPSTAGMLPISKARCIGGAA